MRRTLLLVIGVFLLTTCITTAQAQVRFDGNWWEGLSKDDSVVTLLVKEAYVSGLVDGRGTLKILIRPYLVYEDSVASVATKHHYPAITQAFDIAFAILDSSEFRNMTIGQIVDGLDSFYSDFRNRRIEVYQAFVFVIYEIDGTPQGWLDNYLQELRQAASY